MNLLWTRKARGTQGNSSFISILNVQTSNFLNLMPHIHGSGINKEKIPDQVRKNAILKAGKCTTIPRGWAIGGGFNWLVHYTVWVLFRFLTCDKLIVNKRILWESFSNHHSPFSDWLYKALCSEHLKSLRRLWWSGTAWSTEKVLLFLKNTTFRKKYAW